MRVLFWADLFWPYIGGAEIFATKLLLALRERGYEFIIVTRQDSPDLPQEDRYKGMPVYRFPFWEALMDRDVDQLMAVRRQVAMLKRLFVPDLIHIHQVGPSILFYLETANAHPAPLLVTLTEERPEHVVESETLGRVLRSADWVTGKAAAVLAQARQQVPEIMARSCVIQNGLEVPPLPPEPLPLEAPRLLCLGRLDPQKGFDLALSAVASLIARFPQIRLVIAGEGPERKKLEGQVGELGLTKLVDFIGWVAPDQVPGLINTTTMVVMPSRWEGFPSVALQAAIMARPVVATRVGGLPEAVAHQQTGLLVETQDSSGLAEAIAFFLEHPEAAVQMGQAARSRAREAFSWERCVEAYDALYRKLGRETACAS